MLGSSSWLRKSASHVENSGFESPIEYHIELVLISELMLNKKYIIVKPFYLLNYLELILISSGSNYTVLDVRARNTK